MHYLSISKPVHPWTIQYIKISNILGSRSSDLQLLSIWKNTSAPHFLSRVLDPPTLPPRFYAKITLQFGRNETSACWGSTTQSCETPEVFVSIKCWKEEKHLLVGSSPTHPAAPWAARCPTAPQGPLLPFLPLPCPFLPSSPPHLFSPPSFIFPSYKTFHRVFYYYYFCLIYSWHIIPCCPKSTLVKAAAFEWLTGAAARRSVNLVQQGMGSQLQKEKRGPILCFKMVKMLERREIYTKYKKGVEQRKERGRGRKGVGKKEERGKWHIWNKIAIE